jgi:hypothetical protein
MDMVDFVILFFLVVGIILLVLYFTDKTNNDFILVVGIVLVLVGLYLLYQKLFPKKASIDGYKS